MSADEHGSKQILDLITAVADGDAEREDVVSSMRDKGIDSLDVLVEVLAQVRREGSGGRAKSHPLDPQRLAEPSPPERTAKTVHRAPTQPFMLRGTLYDPGDISRFNGTELHFLAAPGKDHLLIFDDRSVMESWWQLSFISGLVSSSNATYLAAKGRGAVDTSVGTTDFGVGGGAGGGKLASSGGGYPPFVLGSGNPSPPGSYFFEHPGYNGSNVDLEPNRGYPDLTEVGHWFESDWNDRISSIWMVEVYVAVLYEHVNYAGSTYTALNSHDNVGSWNDVASSCGTW